MALLFTLPGLLIAALGVGLAVVVGGAAGIALGGVLILGGGADGGRDVRQAVARQVFGVALYHYAADGIVLGPFAQADLAGATRSEKRAKSAI